jgi:hypothetical protein
MTLIAVCPFQNSVYQEFKNSHGCELQARQNAQRSH